MNPDWLQELDHTADVGFVIRASNLQELFARAAWGMFAIITDPATVQPHQQFTVTLHASDREALLVAWLSELNYRHITQHLLFCQFHLPTLTDHELHARIQGEQVDTNRHTVYTEIKAVTFHGLRIQPAREGWTAQIIFDL